MKHKVYHGEYSLAYWKDLMLSGNIILPPYQRYFVWDEYQARRLMQSIDHEYYIPAVTIASIENPKTHQIENLVLDGQQRLTSILLAYLGKFPVKRVTGTSKFVEEGDPNDGNVDERSEWSYSTLLSYGKNKDHIVNEINLNHPHDYNNFTIPGLVIDDAFMESHYLYFAYVVPDSTIDARERSRYLTNVFFSINSQGTHLSHMECRNALYYQGGNHTETFEPAFSQRIKVNNACMDFVRYLTIISNFKKIGADGFWAGMDNKTKRENLYVEFIRDFLSASLDHNDRLYSYSHYKRNLAKIEPALNDLDLDNKEYTSIIELDMFYAGLFYYIMIEGRDINMGEWENVKSQLEAKRDEYTDNRQHKKSPAKVTYVRSRITSSIHIYEPLFPVI